MVSQVSLKSSVEVGILRLQVSRQATVLHREVIVLFFVHLLVDNILLGDAQGTSSPPFVNLRSPACRLYSGFETAVTSARRSNVCSGVVMSARIIVNGASHVYTPFLILFVCPFGLHWLHRRCSPHGRHGLEESVGAFEVMVKRTELVFDANRRISEETRSMLL